MANDSYEDKCISSLMQIYLDKCQCEIDYDTDMYYEKQRKLILQIAENRHYYLRRIQEQASQN